MDAVGVDVVGLVENTEFIFKDKNTVSFPSFMQLVLDLRGNNTATVKNIVDLQRTVSEDFRRSQQDTVHHVRTLIEKLCKERQERDKCMRLL